MSQTTGSAPAGTAAPASVDTRAFRRTVGLFATGVTVVTVRVGETVHGMTANSFTSVSLNPLLVLVCVDRQARMGSLIERAGAFAVCVLSDRQEDISRYFASTKDGPPPASLRFERDEPGEPPLIHGCLATLRCRVARVLDGGDHLIVLGEVTEFRAGTGGDPLLYFGGRYRSLREPDGFRVAPETWSNDAVQIYYDACAEAVDEHHPMA